MEAQNKDKNNQRPPRFVKLILVTILFSLLLGGIFVFIQYKKTHITTDDAYVKGSIHWIYPRVNGTVVKVLVRDNQFVKQGDTLVLLDPKEYQVRFSEALAELNLAISALKEAKVDVKVMETEINLAKAEFFKSKADFHRAQALFKSKTISRQRYEVYLTSYKITKAKLAAAKQRLRQAQSRVKTAQMRIEVAKSRLEEAKLNLKYTTIKAPVAGYITKKTVEIGNRVNPQMPILAIVPLNDVWIEANYKENQLEKITHGQRAIVKIDAYPGKKFYGRVESIQAGTGAAFSLFPPENATGNWVKITQRIPVKIVLNPSDKRKVLRIGMSAVVTVLVK